MDRATADQARRAVEERLSTLGITASDGFALDATLTPETFARSEGLGPVTAVPPASVGPLPRIALSGETPTNVRGATGGAAASGETALPASADLEILSVLGEGGMGRVHLARQRSLGREVAVKTLKAEVADARTTAMLRAEATTMGRLEHPNVVPVHAVGLDDGGRLVLVMKRIDGVSWRELLRDPSHERWEKLAPAGADRLDVHLDVLCQVARALQFAHEEGIVHRDVKPENVLLGAHGEVYLADWGVALRTDGAKGNELVGTPAYMAPEMVVGDTARIDARTDVFLLGATLHEVLTGSPPHDGRTLHETLLAAFEARPPRYDAAVPTELAAIAAQAMAPRQGDRFATAADFRAAILETRRHRGSIALARSGRAILAELAPRLRAEPSAVDPAIDRRLTEARFALVSALRDWPENREARTALDECLRTMIEHELARENAAAAESLAAELSEPDPDLQKRIRALGARLDARRAEAAALQSLRADQDIGVGFRTRIVTIGLLVAVAVGITVMVFARSDGTDAGLTPRDPVLFSGGILATVVVPIAVFRKRLLANAIGRRLSAVLVLACATLFVHRLVAYSFDVSPSTTLAMDLALLSGFTAACGVVMPRVAWSALIPLAATVGACAFPHRVALMFSIGTLLNLVVIGVIWMFELRAGQRAAADRDGPGPASPGR